jgi:heme/copper-type cytochrome/quinol oxidase subunit 2
MVANAPLKLPTGVRVALTMTTSSDIGISFEILGLEVF